MADRLRVVPALVSLFALAACAGGPIDGPLSAENQAGLDKALAGLTPGKPLSCIPLARSTLSTRAYGRTLIYSMPGGELYRNDTAGGCESAGRGDTLVTVQYQGRPCQGDIIRTVNLPVGMTTGSCALGEFVPYRKVK